MIVHKLVLKYALMGLFLSLTLASIGIGIIAGIGSAMIFFGFSTTIVFGVIVLEASYG